MYLDNAGPVLYLLIMLILGGTRTNYRQSEAQNGPF